MLQVPQVCGIVSFMPDEQTYGPAEVCEAAGVPRATFHSWLARHYLPLPPSLGAGRERRFSIRDAVRVAIVAELNRVGVSVGVAARAAGLIFEPFTKDERRIGLLLVKSPAAQGDEGLHGPAVMKLAFKSLDEVMFHVALRHAASSPSFTFLDVTDIAERTLQALEGKSGDLPPPDWLENYLHGRRPVQASSSSEIADPLKPAVKRTARSRKAAAPKA